MELNNNDASAESASFTTDLVTNYRFDANVTATDSTMSYVGSAVPSAVSSTLLAPTGTSLPCECPSANSSGQLYAVFSSDDFFIGLALALSSSIFIGSSFIIKKKGLQKLTKHGNTRAGSGGHGYLKDWLWWAGFITMGLGETLNFVAYAFAPATLVTPLGAFSVLISNVLSSRFLNEKLNLLGKVSCVICVMGSTIIVLHSPKEGYLANMEELWNKMQEFSFIAYLVITVIFTLVLIFYVGPAYGQSNVLVYILVCSFLGSFSVLGCKGLGIAIRETASGASNELNNWLTWLCLVVVVLCIVVQTHYLNKSLDIFSAALITPIFYVTFTTCVIVASAILFKEWNNMNVRDVLGNLCGFTTVIASIFMMHAFKDVDVCLKDRFQRSEESSRDMGTVNEKLLSGDKQTVFYESSEHALKFPRYSSDYS